MSAEDRLERIEMKIDELRKELTAYQLEMARRVTQLEGEIAAMKEERKLLNSKARESWTLKYMILMATSSWILAIVALVRTFL